MNKFLEEDEMDELEDEADDYDEYDMDHGSEGDMDGEFPFCCEPQASLNSS